MLHKKLTTITHGFKTQNKARRTTSFLKIGENVDLYKSVLNKIMTTDKECIKFNFVVPLGSVLTWIYGEIRRDKNENYAQNNEALSKR